MCSVNIRPVATRVQFGYGFLALGCRVQEVQLEFTEMKNLWFIDNFNFVLFDLLGFF